MATPAIPEVSDLTGYDADLRFYATRYKQGGRTVFSMDLSLVQVEALVPVPDPEKLTPGNRAIRKKHAEDFGRYLRLRPDWVAPSIILRAANIFKFEALAEVEGTEFGVVSFPRYAGTDINILDGQHRILGIHYAKKAIGETIDQARSNLAAAKRIDPTGIEVKEAQKRIDELKVQENRMLKERVNIQIHVVEDPTAYKQMFFDIADNALGITASVKARFDNRKVVNRSLEGISDHPLLVDRVDPERDRVGGKGSPYLIGAKHVAEIARTIAVGLEGRVSRYQEAEFSENDIAMNTKRYLDTLTEAFPDVAAVQKGDLTPDGLRKKSLLGSVLMLRILAGVYYDLVATDRAWDHEKVVEFFTKLSPHMEGPVYDGSVWMEHTDTFDDGGMAPRGRRQDIRALKEALLDWAITNPKWLDKKPAPRPKSIEQIESEDAAAERAGAEAQFAGATK